MFPLLLASTIAIALASPGNFTRTYPVRWDDECPKKLCVAWMKEISPMPSIVEENSGFHLQMVMETEFGMDYGSKWEVEIARDKKTEILHRAYVDHPEPLFYDELIIEFHPIDLPINPGFLVADLYIHVGRILSGKWMISGRLFDELGYPLVWMNVYVDAVPVMRKMVKRADACETSYCDGRTEKYQIVPEEVTPGARLEVSLRIEHRWTVAEKAFFSVRILENGQLLAAGRLNLHEPTPFVYLGLTLELRYASIPAPPPGSEYFLVAKLERIPARSIQLHLALVGDNGEFYTEDVYYVVDMN